MIVWRVAFIDLGRSGLRSRLLRGSGRSWARYSHATASPNLMASEKRKWGLCVLCATCSLCRVSHVSLLLIYYYLLEPLDQIITHCSYFVIFRLTRLAYAHVDLHFDFRFRTTVKNFFVISKLAHGEIRKSEAPSFSLRKVPPFGTSFCLAFVGGLVHPHRPPLLHPRLRA